MAADKAKPAVDLPSEKDLGRAVTDYIEQQLATPGPTGSFVLAEPVRVTGVTDIYCRASDDAPGDVDCKFTIRWVYGSTAYWIATLDRGDTGWEIISAKWLFRER